MFSFLAMTASLRLVRRFCSRLSVRSFMWGKFARMTLSSWGQISSDVEPDRVAIFTRYRGGCDR